MMRRFWEGFITALIAAFTIGAVTGALAQGFFAPGPPFQFTPLTPGQHGVVTTASTPLTVPAGARYAVVCAAVQPLRYTTDGTTTPTIAVGNIINVNTCVNLSGPTILLNFRAFQGVAGALMEVEYFQ